MLANESEGEMGYPGRTTRRELPEENLKRTTWREMLEENYSRGTTRTAYCHIILLKFEHHRERSKVHSYHSSS